MKTLKSLLFLTEADLPVDGPVAVEDLVKYFPSKHAQAINKLWGTHRLTYKGKQFFAEGEGYGPVYKGVIKAGMEALKTKSVNFDVNPNHSTNQKYNRIIQKFKDDHPEIELENFEADVKIDRDPQEVYLGYQALADKLWIGFDAWVDARSIDDELETYMDKLRATAENISEDVLDAISGVIEEALRKESFFGVLIELDSSDGSYFTVDDVIIEDHGFYKGVYGSPPFTRLKLTNLRLD